MKWLRCFLLGHVPVYHLKPQEIITYVSEHDFKIIPGMTKWVTCLHCKKQLTQKKTEPYNQDTKLIPGT